MDTFRNDFKKIKNEKNVIGFLLLLFNNSIFYCFINFYYNFIKILTCSLREPSFNCHHSLCRELCDCKKVVDCAIDIEVILLFIASIIFYIHFIPNDLGLLNIIAYNFFIWQIITILIFKIREITNSANNLPITSFSRTFGSLIINFIELILSFSFLYYYFGVFKTSISKLAGFLDTLLIFVTIGTNNITYTCPTKQKLLLFQIGAYLIYVVVFITNVANLKTKNDLKY